MALQDNQPAAAPMSNEERGELLRHLKIKWASVNVEYQKLGFVMDIGRHPAAGAALSCQPDWQAAAQPELSTF
jgi:hypothetical protein